MRTEGGGNVRSVSAIPAIVAVASPRPSVLRYGAAIVSVGMIVGLRLLLDPLLGSHASLLPFTVAVMIAGWYGGLAPGLLATALSAICVDLLWLPPTHSLAIQSGGDRLSLAIFLVVGVAISALNEAVVMARARSERHAAELDLRRRFGSPPFGRLVKLTVALADRDAAEREGAAMADRLRGRAEGRATVIGPAPAYIARRNDRWRYHLVLRGEDPVAVLGGDLGPPWSVDVDPETLL